MQLWQQQLQDSQRCPKALAALTGLETEVVAAAAAAFPVQLTPHILAQMQSPDGIWARQFLPRAAEARQTAGAQRDPLHEEPLSPVPGLVHRYPYRVLFLVTDHCAAYCRFCTRRRRVGRSAAAHQWQPALDYIACHEAIQEVILSGGDPLTLSDEKLQWLLQQLAAIDHVRVLRLGSRTPVTLPERITPALCRLLQQHQPLYLLSHCNHPQELTPATRQALQRLHQFGIPMANQSVLLAGINDRPEVLERLNFELLSLGVRPYYLHHLDLTAGIQHFRVPIEQGLAIMRQLRQRLSGLALPTYVLDTPGGHGKIPLTPQHVLSLGAEAVIQAPDGSQLRVPNQGTA